MKKILIIHGYPQELSENHPVNVFFTKKGYKIFAPKLFSSELDFNLKNSIQIIKETLGKDKPDLILGFSLGGLILPHIAKDYPKARLIFASTGIGFYPNIVYRIGITIAATPLIYPGLFLLKLIPYSIFYFFYRILNPAGKDDDKEWYEIDKELNYKSITSIPAKKQMQILRMIREIDNTNILKQIQNKSIVLGGENDKLMPISGSQNIHKLLKHSILVKVKKSHFSVIDIESLEKAYVLL